MKKKKKETHKIIAFDKMKVGDKKAQVEGTLAHYWWECKLVLPPPKTVGRFLKKLKTELLYDPAMPLLDIHPENMKTFSRKDTCITTITAALFTTPRRWKQYKRSSTNNWIKLWYISNRILLSHKNNKILPFEVTQMNLGKLYLVKSYRGRQIG